MHCPLEEKCRSLEEKWYSAEEMPTPFLPEQGVPVSVQSVPAK
jgi:hypothetical protein